jgi:hypothetical protein
MFGFNDIKEVFIEERHIDIRDEDVCPYWVIDGRGRGYWYSPITMEPVVLQCREGIC